MTLLDTVFVTISAVLLALFLRGQQKDLAVLLSMAALIVIFTFTGGRIKDAVVTLSEIAENSNWSDVGKVMLKGLGITALSRIASDLCTQTGETALAGQIETAGAVEITLLSLPLAARLLEIAGSFLS